MTDNKKQLVQLIKSISGQSNLITVPRIFIDIAGDLNTAVLLSQIVYWSDKSKREDGWFYKSYPEWEDEIGLTQFQVKRSSDKLGKMGLLEVRLKRANKAPTLHYKLDFLLLTNLIIKKLNNQESEVSDYKETQQSDYKETSQTLTETTPYITTEISREAAPASSDFSPSKSPTAIVAEATSMVYIPPKESERIEQIQTLVDHYGETKVIEAFREAYKEWTNSKSKRGTHYRGTNFAWVDWAQDALANNGNHQKPLSEMTPEERIQFSIDKYKQEASNA